MNSGAFDFSGLTEAQQRLLTLQGWSPGLGKQPRPATVRKLVERGLVVARERPFMSIKITVYDVPIQVHAAWCQHCADTEANHA